VISADLGFFQKSEWEHVTFSSDFSCSYAILGTYTLLVRGNGFTTEEAERASLAFGKRIADKYIPSDGPFILIHDWRRYRDGTLQARKLFMDFIVNNKQLKLVVFCNCSWSQELSIRLGRALGFLKTGIRICRTYHEAVKVASFYVETGSLPPDKLDPFAFLHTKTARYNKELLGYLESIDWKSGKQTGEVALHYRHPLLPVFDSITLIRSELEKTFRERDKAEAALREHQQNLEALIHERTAALKASEIKYRKLLELTPAALAVLTPHLSVSYVNAAFTTLFGYSLDRFSSPSSFTATLCPDPAMEAQFTFFLASHLPEDRDLTCTTDNGTIIYVQVSLNTISDSLLLSFTDITLRKKTESRLFELSLKDELTGIYNRRHFVSVLSQELQHYQRYGTPISLLLFDIDLFKVINDTWGHPAGDFVLRELSSRIAGQIRDIDIFFRTGGEEFAVVMPGITLEQGEIAAERLRAVVADTPFLWESAEITVTISIGLAEAEQPNSDPKSFFRKADNRLYWAKKEGRNCVCSSQ